MTEQRLIDLEIKFSHQEFVLQELQNALYEQHKAMAALAAKVKVLQDRIDALSPAKTEAIPINEKPPHY